MGFPESKIYLDSVSLPLVAPSGERGQPDPGGSPTAQITYADQALPHSPLLSNSLMQERMAASPAIFIFWPIAKFLIWTSLTFARPFGTSKPYPSASLWAGSADCNYREQFRQSLKPRHILMACGPTKSQPLIRSRVTHAFSKIFHCWSFPCGMLKIAFER